MEAYQREWHDMRFLFLSLRPSSWPNIEKWDDSQMRFTTKLSSNISLHPSIKLSLQFPSQIFLAQILLQFYAYMTQVGFDHSICIDEEALVANCKILGGNNARLKNKQTWKNFIISVLSSGKDVENNFVTCMQITKL